MYALRFDLRQVGLGMMSILDLCNDRVFGTATLIHCPIEPVSRCCILMPLPKSLSVVTDTFTLVQDLFCMQGSDVELQALRL